MERAPSSGRMFLLCYADMARYWNVDKGEARYKLRPKLHYIDHILEDLASRENPRLLSNFLDEDFMGKLVKLARMQHRSAVVPRTLQLYIAHIREMWRDHRDSNSNR